MKNQNFSGDVRQMNPFLKKVLIDMAVVIAFLSGVYSFLNWGLSDHKFRYGDLNYWLLTDSEIRSLPIVGAKLNDVRYAIDPAGDVKPCSLSITYSSRSDPQRICALYQAYYHKLGYSLAPPDQLRNVYLRYQGKERCEKIEISIQTDRRASNVVRISYIMKSEE